MIIKSHTNKVHPKSKGSSSTNLADNIYSVGNEKGLSLLKQSNLVRQVSLVSLDFLTLLMISFCLYWLFVLSCLFDQECFTTFYGV